MNINANVNGRALSLASLSYAHSLFNLLPDTDPTSCITRSPVLFNLLIRALSSPASSSALALRYFSLLLRYSRPDSYSFPFLFSAYTSSSSSSSMRARASQAAHSLALKHGFLPRHHHTAHSLITMYSSFNHHSSARKVFDQIPPDDKDVVSWNSIISAYVNMALPRRAICLFHHMLSQGFWPNHVTLLPLLSACSQLGDLETGKWLEAYIHETNMLQGCGSFLCSALIGMYAKCGALDHSRRIFDSVPHTKMDNFIWNSMITGYAQNGMANEAIALFLIMKQSKASPNERTLVGVLSACASIGALDLGKQLDHYAFNKGLYANVFVGTALIDMYGKCGHLDGAIHVFDKMPHKNDATWNAFISALALNSQGKHALNVFYQMIQQGIRPDDITFISVLSACVHAGLVQQGREWFHRMQVEFHISPKKEHYSCMVNLLARAGHLDEAWHFIEQMGRKADAVVLGALLSACRKRKCLEVGEKVTEKLLEMEPSNSWNYVVSSRLYEGSNRMDDFARMRGLMRDRGVTKTPGCSWIENSGQVHEFYAGMELHSRVGDIYEMIHLLVWEMRLYGYVPNTEL